MLIFSQFFFAEERKLADKERPLIVQLNWGKDDREGRFLLKNEDQSKAAPVCLQNSFVSSSSSCPYKICFRRFQLHGDQAEAPGTFKRKLSKREKKEMKGERGSTEPRNASETLCASNPTQLRSIQFIQSRCIDENSLHMFQEKILK